MSDKPYHISPLKGPKPCGAKVRCRYAQELHHPDKATAEKEYHELMSTPQGWIKLRQLIPVKEMGEFPRYNWDGLDVKPLPDDTFLITETQKPWYDGTEPVELWVTDQAGDPVGWANVALHKRDEMALVLCDIEVRDGHTGEGVAKKLLKQIEKQYKQKVYVTGSFTPEGFAAFNDKLPILPPEYGGKDWGRSTFDSMKFVNNWDTLRSLM